MLLASGEKMRRKTGFFAIVLAVLMGLGGELHLPIPGIGYVAMFDLTAYDISLPIIFMSWNKMGKWMRRSLGFSFAWAFAAMVANMMNYYELKYWLKCVALASSSWAIIAAAYFILKDRPILYLWYLAGAGLGGWICIYYFRNGALESFASGGVDYMGTVGASTEYLMDKQVYPNVAKGIVLGIILPLFIIARKMPIFIVVCISMAMGVWLLINGGSRSSFGIFCVSAMAGVATVYMKNLFFKMVRNRVALIIIILVSIGTIFASYKYMAIYGRLGESELIKYEREFGDASSGVIDGRAGLMVAIRDANETNWIGRGGHLRCHSVIANSLACEGAVGFVFWIFFYLQVLWFVSHRLPRLGKMSLFIMIMVLTSCWDVFGSPFGTRHKFFVLMAFIALCRDDAFYGVPDVFSEPDPRDVKTRRWW